MPIFKSESRLSLLCVWCDHISLSLEDRTEHTGQALFLVIETRCKRRHVEGSALLI